MTFHKAKQMMFQKLGNAKIMALASCRNQKPKVRNVSCIFYNDKIYFKTDLHFEKTKDLLDNENVAMCWSGVQVEGTAKNLGLVVEEKDRKFEQLYKEYWWKSYNAYSHEDTEILIEVTPTFVEVWDQDENDFGFQTLIDFKKEEVQVVYYDKEKV